MNLRETSTSRLSTLWDNVLIAAAILTANALVHADQMTVLNQAVMTVDKMESDPTFGPSREILRGARAVLIVPQLIKGGLVFGAEGGGLALLQRLGRGWSAPAFCTLGPASFGLQIGLEELRFVMFIMSDRALRAVEQSKFTFGGESRTDGHYARRQRARRDEHQSDRRHCRLGVVESCLGRVDAAEFGGGAEKRCQCAVLRPAVIRAANPVRRLSQSGHAASAARPRDSLASSCVTG